LRDGLKAALSGREPQEGQPTAADVAERIKSLRAANTVETPAERTGVRRVSAEEPVTSRIRRRAEEPTTVVEGADVAAAKKVTALGD
jgi:hypothetical protein